MDEEKKEEHPNSNNSNNNPTFKKPPTPSKSAKIQLGQKLTQEELMDKVPTYEGA